MQNNKGERGQNPLTSHLSSSQEVLIPRFHGDHATLICWSSHLLLSYKMLKERPM